MENSTSNNVMLSVSSPKSQRKSLLFLAQGDRVCGDDGAKRFGSQSDTANIGSSSGGNEEIEHAVDAGGRMNIQKKAIQTSRTSALQQKHEGSSSEGQRLDLFEQEDKTNTGYPKHEQKKISVQSAMEKIETVWNWLYDNDVATIKIEGEEGVGKTWTARHVFRRAANIFDVVIWVDLANDVLSDEMVQMEILSQSKLVGNQRFKEEMKNNLTMTKEELKKEILIALEDKRYMLILNDVISLNQCNLENLGIPINEHNKESKVLVTGRKSFTKHLVTDRVLELKRLPEDEAWMLFQNVSVLEIDSPHTRELLNPWLEDCEGLPSEIVNLGESLNMLWDANFLETNAYSDFLNSRSHAEAFLCQILPSENVRECFLYCTLYPSNHLFNVKGLLMSWIYNGFQGEFVSLEEAYEKSQSILEELIDRCVLFKYDNNHVKINFLLRDQNLYSFSIDHSTLKYSHSLLNAQTLERRTLLNENLQKKIADKLTSDKPDFYNGLNGMVEITPKEEYSQDGMRVSRLEGLSMEYSDHISVKNLDDQEEYLPPHPLSHKTSQTGSFSNEYSDNISDENSDDVDFQDDWGISFLLRRKNLRLESPSDSDNSSDGNLDVSDHHDINIQEGNLLSQIPRLDFRQLSGESSILPTADLERTWIWLNDKNVKAIAIDGEAGSGKTWIASRVTVRAVHHKLFNFIIWINLDKKFQSAETMLVHILYCANMREANRIVTPMNLWSRILRHPSKKYLLIFDDVPSVIPSAVREFLSSKEISDARGKILCLGPRSHTMNLLPQPADRILTVKRLAEDDACLLFKKIVGFEDPVKNLPKLIEAMLQDCGGLPSRIVNLGESAIMKSAAKLFKLEEFGYILLSGEDLDEELICKLLPSKLARECFLCSIMYLQNYRSTVTWLITCWIFEGYLDGYSCLEEAYAKGQEILKEIVDQHLLFTPDDDDVEINILLRNRGITSFATGDILSPDRALSRWICKIQDKFSLLNEKFEIKYSDCATEYSFSNNSLLLLYGKEGFHPRQVSDVHFEEMQHLQVLGLLHLGISFLPPTLSNLQALSVLVVRGCGLLQNVDQIKGLQKLKSLSLSGSTSLRELPDDFFQHMFVLEYLDLSESQIKKLPSSFSNLDNIETLILRDCSHLDSLPSMRNFKKLTLLDLSGATSLEKLNLSETPVEIGVSKYNLQNLKYIFLRGCSEIKTIPHIDDIPNLQVLDLSGARAFLKFESCTVVHWRNSSLEELDLSGSQISELHFLSRQKHLQKLLLRDCCNVKILPPLVEFDELKLLDLSGAISFKKFLSNSFGNQLTCLDLSKTQIEKLPVFAPEANLVQLLLRECECLQELPVLELKKLEILDLSGSSNFKKFKDASLEKLSSLQILNLSATQVADLPVLSKCIHLQQILLSSCLKLEKLPSVKPLERLEVLELSGATSFKHFHDDSLGKKEGLQELNLSHTQVAQVPNLSECHNLCKLILRGCSKLEILPKLESLLRLEVLDLSGAVSFTMFGGLCIGCLQVLDLSGTCVSEFSFLSGCTSLCNLVLADCLNFQAFPPLKELTRLEVLDLSGTLITELSFPSGCRSLRQLLLRNCLKLAALPPLKEYTGLEVLDLCGTEVADYSFLSGCNNLHQLSVRGCSNLKTLSFEGLHNLQSVDLSETDIEVLEPSFLELRNLCKLILKDCSSLTMLPHLEILRQLEVFDLSCTKIKESSDGTSKKTHLRFLGIQKGDYSWRFDDVKGLHRFHICLFFLREHLKENDVYMQGQGCVFKDIYYQTNNIPQLTEEPDKFFKICGFQALPDGIEDALNEVDLLYLKKNDFITRLSDLGAKSIVVMRECWIESCDNMKSAFYGEEREENEALGRCLENLWVSKLSNLNSLFSGVVQSDSFACLKQLYIECCPRLITVFSSHMELKTLIMLKIKFCDALELIFGETVSNVQSFPKLKTLTLWKLPKLQSICGGILPSLRNVTVKGCPELKLPVIVNSSSRLTKIRGELSWWNTLKGEDERIDSNLRFTALPI